MAVPAAPLALYRDHLEQGVLAFQRAPDGTPVFFPRVAAPGSGAALSWEVSAGLGTVYTATTVHPKDAPAYNVSLIDMDEGFRLMSRVEGIDPAAVAIGLRVRVRIARDAAGTPFPVFDRLPPEDAR